MSSDKGQRSLAGVCGDPVQDLVCGKAAPRRQFLIRRAALLALAAVALAAPPLSAAEDFTPVSLSHAAERTPEGKAAHEGRSVKVSGIVTVASGAFYDDLQKTYIQDADGALCLFSRKALVSVQEGDLVEAEGRLESYAGTVQLYTSRLTVVAKGTPVAPVEVPPEALLSPGLSGRLVQITGVVVGVSSRGSGGLDATLAAGDELLTVHLTKRQAQTFPTKLLGRGATVRVQGIASQYDRTPPFDSGWQVLPRDVSDLVLLQPPPLFTGRQVATGVGILGALLLAIGAWSLLLRAQVRRRTVQYHQTAQDLEEANQRLLQAIAKSEAVYRLLFEASPQPMWLFEPTDGTFLAVNGAAVRHYGYSREEFLSMRVTNLHPPEEVPEFLAHFRKVTGDPGMVDTGHWRHRRKNGTLIDVEVSSSRAAFAGADAILALTNDITERKLAEESLWESEARLQMVVNSAPIVLWALDRDGVFTLSEGKGLGALGLRPGEVVGRSVEDVYREAPQVLECSRRALAGESFAAMVEVGEHLFEVQYRPLRDPAGNIAGAIGVATDTTERTQARDGLQEPKAPVRPIST